MANKYAKNNTIAEKSWCGQIIAPGAYHLISAGRENTWANDSTVLVDIGYGDLVIAKDDTGNSDLTDVAKAINFLKNIDDGPVTKDNRKIISSMRMPAGYTIFPTGQADNITTGTRGGGNDIKMTKANPFADFQLLDHFYAIGGRAVWEGATMDDSVDSHLVAPATVGTNVAGDYNKIEIIPSSGMHLYQPVAPGTGTWSLDALTTTLNANVGILKYSPVPVAGNTGFFDYDPDTNTLTPNYTMTGGYNLYDFDATLFCFLRKIWGRKQDGSETILEVPDVEGKLLFNFWKVRFTLNTTSDTAKVAGIVTMATKQNV